MVIGIDVGQKGGICCMSYSGIQLMPYSDESLNKITTWCSLQDEHTIAYVEQVHAMPNQGGTSMFNFGKSFGYILGVLDACNIETKLVSPQKWKKEFNLDSDKQKSIDTAKKLFPDVNLFRTNRCKKEHDGMAESLLIAEYGRRKEIG